MSMMEDFEKNLCVYLEGLLSEITTTANIAAYNPVLFFTSQEEDIMGNLEAHQTNRKNSNKTPTKQSVESALPNAFSADKDWYKVNPVGENKKVQKAVGRPILKEGLLKEEGEDGSQEAEPIADQPLDNAQPTQPAHDAPADTIPKLLGQLEQQDVITIYNHIFVPYFHYMANRFDIKNKQTGLPLFQLYVASDRRLSSLRQDQIEPKHMYLYTRLRDANAQIVPVIQELFQTLDLKPIADPKTSVDAVFQLMVKNFSALVKATGRMLNPIANGYVQVLQGVDNPGLHQLGEAAKAAQTVESSIKILGEDAKRFLMPRLSGIQKTLNGTRLISVIQGVVHGFDPTLQLDLNGQIDKGSVNLLAANPITKQFVDKYRAAFNMIVVAVKKYDETFNGWTENLKPEMFMQSGHLNKQVIARVLRSDSAGLLNQVNDIKIEEIAQQLKSIYKNQFAQDSQNKEFQSKHPTNDAVKNYLLIELGFTNDKLSEYAVEFLKDIVVNLKGYTQDGEGKVQLTIGESTDAKQLHDILLSAVNGESSLKAFLQNYLAISHMNELVLLLSDKMQFGQFKESFEKVNFEEDPEDEEKDTSEEIKPLIVALGSTSLHGRVHGHDIQWKANQGTSIILKNTSKNLLESLIKEPKEFWMTFMFDDAFKKLLFTGGEPNQQDIESAEKALHGSSSTKGGSPFVQLLKQGIAGIKLTDNARNSLAVNTFGDILKKYGNESLKEQNKDVIKTVGIAVEKFFKDFLEKFGNQLQFQKRSNQSFENKADFLANNLLQAAHGRQGYSKDDIAAFKDQLIFFLKAYANYDNIVQGKFGKSTAKGKEPAGSNKLNDILVKICEMLAHIYRGE